MFRRAWGVGLIQIKKTLRHPRSLALLILLFIYIDFTLRGVHSFCKDYDVTISLWGVLAQIFGNARTQCCLMLFFVFLLIDLPGADENEQTVLMRSGAKAWMLGKFICVAVLTFVWMITITILTMIVIRRISFTMNWDVALQTLARTDAYKSFSIRMTFSSKLVLNWTLGEVFLRAFLLNIALALWSGIWILVLNFATNRPSGNFIIAALAFLSQNIGGILNSGYYYHFSPVSLALATVVDGGFDDAYPRLAYSAAFFVIGMVLGLMILFLGVHMRKDFTKLRV